jgi:hypothetical protein
VAGQTNSEPVAWVNTDQDRRVFYTSLGSPDDFTQPFLRRLLVNAVFWSLGRPVPREATRSAGNEAKVGLLNEQEKGGSVVSGIAPNGRQEQPLSPKESLGRFKIAEDLQIDQVLTEPMVRQPD